MAPLAISSCLTSALHVMLLMAEAQFRRTTGHSVFARSISAGITPSSANWTWFPCASYHIDTIMPHNDASCKSLVGRCCRVRIIHCVLRYRTLGGVLRTVHVCITCGNNVDQYR